jgi:glyoxylase-like metal-dependent hydrolase (beta-lactamase superfamily II)
MNVPSANSLSRRRFLAAAAMASGGAWFAPRALSAQMQQSAPAPPVIKRVEPAEPVMVTQGRIDAANAKITTQRLRGNICVLLGSGGNIAVLPGREGKLLVDSGISTSRPQITAALAAISPDPIEGLINTHWHFGHTDGNEWMHAAGATIVAHDKTRQRMSTPQEIAIFNAHFPPAPIGALPTRTFFKDDDMKMNGHAIILNHYDPAHTDTDISVLFADADVLHTGDTWFNGMYPFIDYSTGGHIDGMIRAAQTNLAVGTDSTILIPGHGPVGNKDQLSAAHDMMAAVREKVAALKKQGRSVDDAVAAKPTAQYDAKWGKGFVTPEMFTRLVYQGV